MSDPFYTIGHSTQPIREFIDLLSQVDVQIVIDVRTVPRSRTNTQYNRDVLSETLSAHQIGYEHIVALGGLRGQNRNISSTTNAYWVNQSFHNYADYAMTDAFRSGLSRLCEIGHTQRCVIMCAEAVWWRCHRRIIADYLITAGERVFHILRRDHIEQARITGAARPGSNQTLIYKP